MRCGSEWAATRPPIHRCSIRNGRGHLPATWSPSGSPPNERSDRGALTPPADREESHDEFPSWRTDARGDVVRAHYPGRYGGGRDRPARTRGNAEADRPEADPAGASMGIAGHSSLPRKRNLISADSHFLFHCPPHGIRCKPLDEAARRVGAPPLRRQLRKKWKTRQGKQHVDQIAQRFRAQLTVLRHAANENRQQAPAPLVALAHTRPEFRIACAGGVQGTKGIATETPEVAKDGNDLQQSGLRIGTRHDAGDAM